MPEKIRRIPAFIRGTYEMLEVIENLEREKITQTSWLGVIRETGLSSKISNPFQKGFHDIHHKPHVGERQPYSVK